ASSVRSARTARWPSPANPSTVSVSRFPSRPEATTAAPAKAAVRHTSRPIPDEAPVTSIRFPVRLKMAAIARFNTRVLLFFLFADELEQILNRPRRRQFIRAQRNLIFGVDHCQRREDRKRIPLRKLPKDRLRFHRSSLESFDRFLKLLDKSVDVHKEAYSIQKSRANA